ncbi:MAG: DNA polymerase IV [Pseudomonadota bacterium]|nr:DNA polymerase IV [Pseudomonadota bacterium]
MSAPVRKVLHIDCDCFFAAVEMRENPELHSVPIAIGGESDRRGVIATCNYPARAFGVRSAMATATARRLCPDLVMLKGRMNLYREVSAQVMAILREYSPLLEQVSVDEAYLELDPEQQASQVAADIRARIRDELGITVSVGGAPNKFLAKVASDWNKPDGQKMIPPQEVDEFVAALPVGKIPGVGPAFQSRLQVLGIETCADAQSWELNELVRRFGRSGVHLYQRSRGMDNRPLSMERERKSVSVERTYAQDITRHEDCVSEVSALYARWQERVSRTPWKPEALAPFVKVKFADFTQTTLADVQESASPEGFERLLRQALLRDDKPVRLLGIGGRFPQVSEQQLSLF